MRNVVGPRRARIRLDAEMVDVAFDVDEQLRVEEPGGDVSGEGGTDRDTVLDMLDGYIEVTDAIIEGRLAVSGETENVSRMFVALGFLRCKSSLGTSARTRAGRREEPPNGARVRRPGIQ
jgi:hypothetical protein